MTPDASGAGDTLTLIAGTDLSMLSVTEAVLVLPARSDAVPVTTCPRPSVFTCCGGVQLARPVCASAHANCTWTSVLFQPAALGGGVALAVMVGGVVSMSAPEMATDKCDPGLLRSS